MQKTIALIIFIIITSCKTNDSYSVRKMNNEERYRFISSNIKSKNGSDLGNFIYHLKESKIGLQSYDTLLFEKLSNSIYPYDIFVLTELLMENPKNASEIEITLESKKQIWDTGNWSEKFWSLIKHFDLKIKKSTFYGLENNSKKKYDVSEFMKSKISNEELGENPMLMINWSLVNYEEGKLLETLEKIDIKQIDYTPKSQTVKLYGKRGVDGALNILTN